MRQTLLKLNFSFVLTIVFLEILLRLFYPAPTYGSVKATGEGTAIFRASDWMMQPLGNLDQLVLGEYGIRYDVQTNEDGLRNAGLTRQKPDGVYRILALGDSFTFGMSAQGTEAYPHRLELCLQEASAPQVQVANAGFQGFSHDAYYIFYQNVGQFYNPDLVVINIFAQNDLQDIMENEWEVGSNGLPIRLHSLVRYVNEDTHALRFIQTPINYRTPILRDLHTYQWLYYLLANPASDNYVGIPPERVVTNPYKPTSEWNTASQQAFESSIQLIVALRDKVEAAGKQFMVVLIPSGQQFSDEFPWVVESTIETMNPQAEYRQALEANQIVYEDMLDDFSGYGVSDTYLGTDAHWTALGNEVAGQSICRAILDQQLIP